MAKKKRSDDAPKPWHISDDCLDPIADGLSKIIESWHGLPGEICPFEISELYRKRKLEFGLTWLKILVSAEFGAEVERKLYRPLKRLRRLSYDANVLLLGMDGEENSDADTIMVHNSIGKIIAGEGGPIGGKRSKIERQIVEIEEEFRAAIRICRYSAAIIRVRVERVGLTEEIVEAAYNPWTPQEERVNKFCYEESTKRTAWDTIALKVKNKFGQEFTGNGVKMKAQAYAKIKNLAPPPARRAGRPKKN